MTSECGVCGRPVPDNAVVCPRCAFALDAALADVCGYQGLAYDLQLAVTRQARIGTRSGGRATETPVVYNERASETEQALKNTLGTWARLIADETGAMLPVDDLARIAAWLRPRVGWLRHHEAGAEAYDQILDAVRDARHAVDRPAERLYAGPCDQCGQAMYARPAAAYVTCRTPECEDLAYPVEDRRRWMVDQLEDLIGGASYVAAICTGLGVKVAESTIRMWVKRRKLRPLDYAPSLKGEGDPDGRPRPMYRVGDVIRVAAGEDIYATGKAKTA